MGKEIRNIDLDEFYALSRPDRIKFLLRFAILAPSTHNSQPWLFKIKEDSCEIYYDPGLKIPNGDPENRDLFISIGCAIENLLIVSSYYKVFGSIEYKLSDASTLVAEVFFSDLEGTSTPDDNLKPLVQTILKRVNARGIFKSEPVPEGIYQGIVNAIPADYGIGSIDIKFISGEQMGKLAELTAKGLQLAYKSKSFRLEMSGWFRNSFTRRKDGLPGYALKMPALVSFFFPTLVKYKDVGAKLASLNEKSIRSAPLACVISAEQEDRPMICIKTGRLAERLMLEFNEKGLNTSIFVASIEMGEIYKEVMQEFGINKRPQFIFIIGKVDTLHKPTPRHKLEEKLLS